MEVLSKKPQVKFDCKQANRIDLVQVSNIYNWIRDVQLAKSEFHRLPTGKMVCSHIIFP